MKYRVEYHDHDRNLATIHLDLDLQLFASKPVKNWLASTEDDECGDYYVDKNTPHFVRRLLTLKGVDDVEYGRYRIDVVKSDFYLWRSVISVVIKDLEMVLNHSQAAKRVHRRQASVRKKKALTRG